MTKDIPIIFSGPMVRALLDGRKTMTRRLLPKRIRQAYDCGPKFPQHWNVSGVVGGRIMLEADFLNLMPWKVGDRLWVRENFAAHWGRRTGGGGVITRASVKQADGTFCQASPEDPIIVNYAADGDTLSRWRPSIHMPRWASRVTMVVTGVKVGRLQNISEADAEAEGVAAWAGPAAHPLVAFAALWASLHGDEAWTANPYVVALTFTVHKQNIDTLANSPTANRSDDRTERSPSAEVA